jgi:hypothetical protein
MSFVSIGPAMADFMRVSSRLLVGHSDAAVLRMIFAGL